MHHALIPVTSLSIDGYRYLPQSNLLIIAFKKGRTYAYQNVSAKVVAGFTAADSKGTYFGKNIKEKYVTQKLSEAEVMGLLAFLDPLPPIVAKRSSERLQELERTSGLLAMMF